MGEPRTSNLEIVGSIPTSGWSFRTSTIHSKNQPLSHLTITSDRRLIYTKKTNIKKKASKFRRNVFFWGSIFSHYVNNLFFPLVFCRVWNPKKDILCSEKSPPDYRKKYFGGQNFRQQVRFSALLSAEILSFFICQL